MKLNNKGFSLIEIIAVIVILTVIGLIVVPSVTGIIEKGQTDSLDDIKKSLISAANIYISDNRYNIKLYDESCTSGTTTIEGPSLNSSRITVQTLIDAGAIDSDKIIHPQNKKQLDTSNSYITVKFNCTRKEYEYNIDNLIWK